MHQGYQSTTNNCMKQVQMNAYQEVVPIPFDLDLMNRCYY